MQKITPCLWFNFNADEAMAFYQSVFPDFKVRNKSYYGEWGGPNAGKLLTADFELFGMQFIALNAGPNFPFTEAISLTINCKGQEEVDFYWDKLTADGGAESMCGWLKDKFGLSWQVAPEELITLMKDPDPARSSAAARAMMKQRKIVIKDIQDAVDAVSA